MDDPKILSHEIQVYFFFTRQCISYIISKITVQTVQYEGKSIINTCSLRTFVPTYLKINEIYMNHYMNHRVYLLYLIGPESFSDLETKLKFSKSQKLTVRSAEAEANKNS